MSDSSIVDTEYKNFESIKHLDNDSKEYWQARELMPLLDYAKWDNFEKVVEKAKTACTESGQDTMSHFLDVGKMVEVGSGAERLKKEYRLSRYACYLIAQNGDSSKKPIAMAQTYFAIQTRNQEVSQQLQSDEQRLFLRGEVKTHNKELFSTAKKAGVQNFAHFNDMGYKGLYGMGLSGIKNRKGVGKDDVLDRAGITELAANLFRITQTDEKIKKEKVAGEGRASMTHFSVGSKVREAIQNIGGTMPENLSPEKHIKELGGNKKKLDIHKQESTESKLPQSNKDRIFNINIPADTPKDKLLKLKSIFEDSPGDTQVILFFAKDSQKIEARQRIKLDVDIQKKIETLLEE